MEESELWLGLHRPDISREEADFVIQGIAFDGGCSQRQGAALAPDYLRKRSGRNPPLTDRGEILDLNIFDAGNLNPRTGEEQDKFFQRVEKAAADIFSCGGLTGLPFPIFLGGDHSVTIPILRALQQVRGDELDSAAIIHIDSHLDICHELDGNTLSHGSTHRRGWELDLFSAEETYFIGIRSMEEQEVRFLQDKSTSIYGAEKIFERGIENVAVEIRQEIEAEAVYITLDIDALDPAFAPGTGTPVAAGLSTRQVYVLLREFAGLPLAGMDLVEVSPPWDNSEITSYAAQRLLFALIGFLTPEHKKVKMQLN